MVSVKAARASNSAREKTSPTALFLGATSGTGLGAIEACLRCTVSPHIIIVGRSESKFAPTVSRLQQINRDAKLEFIEAQISLLREVSRVCEILQSRLTHLDILWLSQGGLAPASHGLTSEGLNDTMAINYYSRLLSIHLLLPLLSAAPSPRVVSCFCAGQEGPLHLDDMGLLDPKNYTIFGAMKHTVMLTSLSLSHLAKQNPRISFLHTNPGMVSTNVHEKWISTMTGPWAVLGWVAGWTVVPFFHSLGYSPEQAGGLGWFECCDGKFAVDGDRNFFRVDEKAEMERESGKVAEYERDGVGTKVWEHTCGVFESVVGGRVV